MNFVYSLFDTLIDVMQMDSLWNPICVIAAFRFICYLIGKLFERSEIFCLKRK